MNGKGLLRVSTKHDKHIEDKQFIIVEIEDTGSGIDEELKTKIFEPYFSTKDGGSNLGIGLYLIDRVIKDHGGFIEFESEKDKGTVFRLYIPVLSGVISKTNMEEIALRKDVLKHKSVLIVDDEPMVREFVRGALAEASAEIFEAADGNEALEIFRRYHGTIDVVILDMIMPGLKGDQVLKELRAVRKDIKVIIASGFMSEKLREKLREFAIDAFLDKPFTDEDISRTLIKVLSK
jgi:two-component system, cell cycle sensor histidine kinase and response regulator CckA